MIAMRDPPIGRARQLLFEKALGILGQSQMEAVKRLVHNYAVYLDVEKGSPNLPTVDKQLRVVRAQLEAVANMPPSAGSWAFTATDGAQAAEADTLEKLGAGFRDHLMAAKQQARQALDMLPRPRIANRQKLKVATDTYGTPERRIICDCAEALAKAGQKVRTSRKGNVRDLARTITEIVTGKKLPLTDPKLTRGIRQPR